MAEPTQRDIFAARRRIQGLARRTPLVASSPLSERVGAPVSIKDESAQVTGSFKLRGAASKILALGAEERRRGLVAVSSGNHGRAVAHVAREVEARAVVYITTRVPKEKSDAIAALGAEVVTAGETQQEADAAARRRSAEEGLTFVHPFDDPLVIAGQGTIGLELLEDLPEIDTAVVPLSGGGLISGIALALTSADPAVRVIGVSQERGPAMYESLRAGRLVEVEEVDTLADALAGSLGAENRYTLALCARLLDDVVLVSEEEIADAMRFAFTAHRLVLEGGGAVALAALLTGRVRPGTATVAVASGGNIAPEKLLEVVA